MTIQKQFGVWLDTRQAVIVGKENSEEDQLAVLATVAADDIPGNTSEKNHNHHERTVQLKYFKAIAVHLQNATQIHVTGTGQVQEQFIHWLEETPQFKNTKTEESTVNKMSEDKLVVFFEGKLK